MDHREYLRVALR